MNFLKRRAKKVALISGLAGVGAFVLSGGNPLAAIGAIKGVVSAMIIDPIDNIADAAIEGAIEEASGMT